MYGPSLGPYVREIEKLVEPGIHDPDSSPRALGLADLAELGAYPAFMWISSWWGRASAPAGCRPRVGEGVVDSLSGLERFLALPAASHLSCRVPDTGSALEPPRAAGIGQAADLSFSFRSRAFHSREGGG